MNRSPQIPHSLATVIVAGITALSPRLHAEITPVSLHCEYRPNPLGIDSPSPRLGWQLSSPEQNQFQSAYQILVASSPGILSLNQGDLWNSGKMASRQSLHRVYSGHPLTSRMRAYWKVRVWDRFGNASPWSEPAWWEMGLLHPEDWQDAHWISHPAKIPPAIRARNGFHSQLADRPDLEKWVTIDLGRPRKFDAIQLFPARPFDWEPDTPGFLFPLRFQLEAADSADFQAPRLLLDQSHNDISPPGTNAPAFHLPPAQARFLRLKFTRLRRRDAANFGVALAEWTVLNQSHNLAAGCPVTASDSIESANWSRAFLVDGDRVSHPGNRPEARPATRLRREFALSAPVRHARLYVTALGLYEIYLNGHRIGNAALAPDWTDYRKRVQYRCFDVGQFLHPGSNAIAAQLGDGWYAGRIGMSDGIFGLYRHVYGTQTELLANLEIETTNSEIIRIPSNHAWKASHDGPIRKSDLLDGEFYDARREMPGWNRPGFDDASWLAAAARPRASSPAVLECQPNEPIQITREVPAVSVSESDPGTYIFDLGQNLVGRCRLHVTGPRGTSLTLRHGEMLNPDGSLYTANLRGAPQTDHYILHGDQPEFFEPHFTQHGFRYVEVTGLPAKPKPNDLTGIVFHSAAPEIGTFECSSPTLNQLWQNILWTQRSNLMSVPTDCPQRDERLGWMGDIQAFSQTAMFNMNLAPFWTKWLGDVRDAQTSDGRFPDFAPHPFGPEYRFSGVPAWGDAGVVIPWLAYVNYGDTRLLQNHFPAARRWIDYIYRENADLIWRNGRHNDYNDWLNGDTIIRDGWPQKGGSIPNVVFATAFFAHSTDLVARMASVLDLPGEAEFYANLHRRIRTAFQREFVHPDGTIQGNTQAGYALALHFNLLPESLQPLALEHLLQEIRHYHSHPSTGIQSTHRMLLELARRGYQNLAWQMLSSHEFPSWGYMIDNGATTIWERWDGYVKNRGFQNPGMNSFNHWALGSVGEWIVKYILGIHPIPAYPAYARFAIHPAPLRNLEWARGSYHSIRGPIRVEWHSQNQSLSLRLAVPPNSIAELHLPNPNPSVIRENGLPLTQSPDIKLLHSQPATTVCEIPSGHYHFTLPQSPQ